MFHGLRWRTDPLYQALMVETSAGQTFVGDFVTAFCPDGAYSGVITAKIIRLYTKV